jgi:hypothetical protein
LAAEAVLHVLAAPGLVPRRHDVHVVEHALGVQPADLIPVELVGGA